MSCLSATLNYYSNFDNTSMYWVYIRRWTEQLSSSTVIILGFEDKAKSFYSGCVWFPHSLHFNNFWAIFSFIPLLCHSWDIVKCVSHTMDYSSKCKPFIGKCRIAYNKVLKTCRAGFWIRQYAREKGIMVRVNYGPMRSSKSQWWISMYFNFFFSLFHPDTGKEMLFVFLRMCNFPLFIPFESSCRILKPSNRGFKGLWRQWWLPAEVSSWCADSVRSGRKTNLLEKKKKKRGHPKTKTSAHGASIKPLALFVVITGKCYTFRGDSENTMG